MPLGETVRELDEQMAALVRRAVDDLRTEMRQRLDEATADLQRRLGEAAPDLPESFISEDHLRRIAEEAAGPTPEALDEARAEGSADARSQAHGALRAALAGIDRARSQADVLQALLEAAGGYAPRVAVLLLRDGGLAGWGARGFESGDQAARQVSLSASAEPWAGLAGGGPARAIPPAGAAELVSQLDRPLPQEAFAVPMVLRDRVAAIVYADRVGESDPIEVEALQILTYAAALALETLTLRDRELTSTLRPAEGPEDVAAATPAVPGGADEAAVAEELEPRFETPDRDWTPPPPLEADTDLDEEIPDLEAPEETGGVREPDETSPDFEEPEVYDLGEEDGFELADAEPLPETRPEPETEIEVEELPPEEAVAFQDEPTGIPTRDYDYPREAEDDEEDELEATAVAEPPAAAEEAAPEPEPAAGEERQEVELDERPEAGAVPPPPPAPPSASGPVEPPSDVEGPGWAFATSREPVSEDEGAVHEEARRLARLLVSEIQLYNQDEVEEGRRNRDIYERLREDIDRSRQLYEERVDPRLLETTDYFYQELVRQLAAGDAKALGI